MPQTQKCSVFRNLKTDPQLFFNNLICYNYRETLCTRIKMSYIPQIYTWILLKSSVRIQKYFCSFSKLQLWNNTLCQNGSNSHPTDIHMVCFGTVTHCWKTIPYFSSAISIECKALFYWRGGVWNLPPTYSRPSVTIMYLDGFHATAR
jgi:hypothetical protein